MPGPLVQQGATVLCAHGGSALPGVVNPRVTVSGMPTVLLGPPWTVGGCSLPVPPTANGPCVTGQWTSGTTRVTSDGRPLVVQSGSSVCAPTGTPLIVGQAQPRVTAT